MTGSESLFGIVETAIAGKVAISAAKMISNKPCHRKSKRYRF